MNRYRKIILLSLKIGIGSSLSLYTAQKLGLNYAVSAGTITLLSLMNSKWETIHPVDNTNSITSSIEFPMVTIHFERFRGG